MSNLLSLATAAKVYDLAQPLYAGVPHFPTHPPFAFSLSKMHGEYVLKNGGSSASELIAMGGHTGTHIDALCHFSCGGKLFGEVPLKQSPSGGVEPHSVESIAPIVRRGVLLDIAAHLGVDVLSDEFTIQPEHLDAASVSAGVDVRSGDVVLLRTGWGRYWHDAHQFTTAGKGVGVAAPGAEEAGAEWLSRRHVFAAGSDTMAFERVPSPSMPVHVHLLVGKGIHIIENLSLDELARDRVSEFLFIAMPLKIRGGTGSPFRPIGLVAPQ